MAPLGRPRVTNAHNALFGNRPRESLRWLRAGAQRRGRKALLAGDPERIRTADLHRDRVERLASAEGMYMGCSLEREMGFEPTTLCLGSTMVGRLCAFCTQVASMQINRFRSHLPQKTRPTFDQSGTDRDETMAVECRCRVGEFGFRSGSQMAVERQDIAPLNANGMQPPRLRFLEHLRLLPGYVTTASFRASRSRELQGNGRGMSCQRGDLAVGASG